MAWTKSKDGTVCTKGYHKVNFKGWDSCFVRFGRSWHVTFVLYFPSKYSFLSQTSSKKQHNIGKSSIILDVEQWVTIWCCWFSLYVITDSLVLLIHQNKFWLHCFSSHYSTSLWTWVAVQVQQILFKLWLDICMRYKEGLYMAKNRQLRLCLQNFAKPLIFQLVEDILHWEKLYVNNIWKCRNRCHWVTLLLLCIIKCSSFYHYYVYLMSFLLHAFTRSSFAYHLVTSVE